MLSDLSDEYSHTDLGQSVGHLLWCAPQHHAQDPGQWGHVRHAGDHQLGWGEHYGLYGGSAGSTCGALLHQSWHVQVTMGTGCFILTNVGVRPIMSNSGLISTVTFKLAGDPTFFGLESSVGCAAGKALDWALLGLGMAREEVVDLQEEE